MEEIKNMGMLSQDEVCKISTSALSNAFPALNPTELDVPVLDFVLSCAFTNGVEYEKVRNEALIKDVKLKELNSGIWLAITEIAFCRGYDSLITDIIRAVGFSHDECLELMESSGCNNDVLEPIVNSIFGVEEDVLTCDFPEDVEIYVSTDKH